MLQFEEFSAWIDVDASEAKEYSTVVDDDGLVPTITCWIASESGKEFTVNWKDSTLHSAITGDVRVDGRAVNGVLLQPGLNNPNTLATTRGFKIAADAVRPFVFSNISVTDDDEYLGKTVDQHFGEITIDIHRVLVNAPGQQVFLPVPSDEKFHERSKKALVHQIGAGASKTVGFQQPYNVTRLGLAVVKFIFKYRTLDQLMANGFAPRIKRKAEPDVADEPEVIELSDSDDEDEEAHATKLAAAKARKAKRAKLDSVKKEKRETIQVGEIIDLT
ncbi:hypothetical protein C8J56DRAFT_822442 [Mycena floridula]|nr:hypothetical protein C8J56DRAFT_822442 [Mycena floridula]